MKSNIVYIISSTTPEGVCYKVGITNNLEKRFKNIKTGNQYPTKIEYAEKIDKSINIREMEDWLHSIFSKERMEGEWFNETSVKNIRKKIYFYLIK